MPNHRTRFQRPSLKWRRNSFRLTPEGAIEQYLALEPNVVEKCMPIVIKNVMQQYTTLANLPPMTIPNARTLLHYLTLLWGNVDVEAKYKMPAAVAYGLAPLVVYLLTIDNNLAPVGIDNAIIFGHPDILRLLAYPTKDSSGRYLWETARIKPGLFVQALDLPDEEIDVNTEIINILLSTCPSRDTLRTALSYAASRNTVVYNRIQEYLNS